MFISTLELFKVGIGPSSSHTLGPMVAAQQFLKTISLHATTINLNHARLRCTLKGSLAYTGLGHATDRALIMGLHGYTPLMLAEMDVDTLIADLRCKQEITPPNTGPIGFDPNADIVFDKGAPLPEHPNGMIFQLLDRSENSLIQHTYFSIGGGFISTQEQIHQLTAPLKLPSPHSCPYPFDSAATMLQMAQQHHLSIAQMKRQNELAHRDENSLNQGLLAIWEAMQQCLNKGLQADGILPGGLNLPRRAKDLFRQLQAEPNPSMNDWLCAYAMAVNEENAAGHMVVTAPTNGAAGVIPAVLYYFVRHERGTPEQVQEFLLTAAAIGGIIKHRSSISGAEVGCQGEVGSAAAMAAAGLCAAKGGNPPQVENAAEIALEHHLGMTCDPVKGLVQVPCIERNGFGAIKAYTAASLALRGSGDHFMPLDNCIAAMKQTGLEMSQKYKETSLGGLAVSLTEC
ncbi:MAG: L-serine ammonia-lyase [Gammaproteobacteria bacterium]|nr:L-serine ammonia-lyase [Gammaproteobacteria bacterium]MDH5801855.1 L-serine ammonia-lyase [Gammaproteobacteria bacterium]